MASVKLTQPLRDSYEALFNSCTIRPERSAAVEKRLAILRDNRDRYQAVEQELGVPWPFVAVVHSMESDCNFNCHLHNGDPLKARTKQVPAGRPKKGNPPFGWAASAADALTLHGLGAGTDWSLAGTLYELERFNGFGYRLFHKHVLSPYLWSFSNHYASGKYTSDGKWSDTEVSKQCGAAVMLRRLAELGEIEFRDQPAPAPGSPPLVVAFSMSRPAAPAEAARAEELQRWLNTFPGIFVKVDGAPGKRTSDAYRQVTGAFLPGDPRG